MKRAIILILFFQSWLQAQVYEFNTIRLANWNSAGEDYSDIWGYAVDGKEYAIIGSRTKILFFNITNPSNPILIDQFGPFTSTSWREFKTYGHYAYAVTDGPDAGGLRIFDLQYLPDTVIQVRQTTEFFTKCHMPFIDEANGRLYCAGTDTRANGIIVLDLTQRPDSPSLVINQPFPRGYVHDLFVRNNIVYASHGGNGLSQYDCTGDTCSGELSNFQTGGYNHSSWMNADNTLLVNAIESQGHPIWLFNLTNGTISSEEYKRFKSKTLNEQFPNHAPGDTLSIAHNPYFKGNRVFVSYYTDGVQIFDVSDVNNIRRVAYFDTDRSINNYAGFRGCWGVYPFLPSGNIIASDIQSGLWIFRVNEAALSLNFIKLTGKLKKENQIQLNVEFISPDNVEQVWLEKSTDEVQFKPYQQIVDWVSQVKFTDQIIDQQVENENFYRLKLIYSDGSSRFSDTVHLISSNSAIKIWPNPAINMINVFSNKDIKQLILMDIQGKKIIQVAQPSFPLTIPQHISNGVYILEVNDGYASVYSKLVVHR